MSKYASTLLADLTVLVQLATLLFSVMEEVVNVNTSL